MLGAAELAESDQSFAGSFAASALQVSAELAQLFVELAEPGVGAVAIELAPAEPVAVLAQPAFAFAELDSAGHLATPAEPAFAIAEPAVLLGGLVAAVGWPAVGADQLQPEPDLVQIQLSAFAEPAPFAPQLGSPSLLRQPPERPLN